jgi:hypothetical protein
MSVGVGPENTTACRWRQAEADLDGQRMCWCARHAGRSSRESFSTRLDLELDFLSFGEGLEPVHHDRREVYEHILAAILFNKP